MHLEHNTETRELIHRRTQCRAYELWEERGRPEGSADEDWYVAERELMVRHADPLEIDPYLTTVAIAVSSI
jgi:Protein of unknown function (DUF2934)